MKRREILRYSMTSGSVAIGAALTGCIGSGGSGGGSGMTGGSPEEWKQKAKEEEDGQLKIMHAMSGASATSFFNAVQEEFPWMNINGVKGSENIGTRFMSEYRAGNPTVDAVWYEDVLVLKKQGMLYNLTNLPNYADLPPEAKGGEYWAPFKFLTYTTLYNTEVMDDPPTGWEDLTKPKYQGKLIMSQSPKMPTIEWIHNNVDENWLSKMAEQDVRIASGHGAAIKQLAAGGRGAMPGAFLKYLFIGNRASGTPVAAPPSWGNLLLLPTPLGISNEAPHPNTAKFFHNWLFSDAGQQTLKSSITKSCMGTANNLLCNPSELQKIARQSGLRLVDQLGPNKKQEIAQTWQNAMGL